MSKLFLGIDLGTSALKVLVSDEFANPIKECKREYDVLSPSPLFNEQNPKDWWNALKDSLCELKKDIDLNDIKAVSFSGQMHGLVVLDENDNVIRPCILWNDGRSFEECKYLNEGIGEDKLIEETGNIAFPGFTLPKLLWMERHEPKLFSRINKIMLPKDYLAYKMSGVFATDYSDASGTLMLDVKNKKWSDYMLGIAKLNVNQLPKLYKSYEVIGLINDFASKELGLNKNTSIVIGGADNAVCAVANGCLNNGDSSISLGTSGTILIIKDKYEAIKNHAVHNFLSCNDYYYHMGCVLNGSSSRYWWVKNILKDEFNNDDNLIKSINKTNVLFIPYLNGERCPYNNPKLTGSFLNLTSKTTREEMSLSVLESSVFSIKDAFEALNTKLDKTMISGGGSRLDLVKNSLAVLLDADIVSTNSEYGPAFGACLLAIRGYTKSDTFIKLKQDNILIFKKNNNQVDKDYLNNKFVEYKKFVRVLNDEKANI